MNNLSSLLLANHNVVEQLVKTVYADSEIVQDDNGARHLLFVSYYRGQKVYFNEIGMVLLYRAAIAFFLGINKQNVNRSISRIEESGFFDQNPHTSINLITKVHGQNSKHPVTFYNGYVISIIASRLVKPSQAALDFIGYREQMLQSHYQILTQAAKVYDEGYKKGFADGQASQAPAIPSIDRATIALPQTVDTPALVALPITTDLPQNAAELAQQWQQLTQQVELLTELVWDLVERVDATEKNHRDLAGKHEELERTYYRDMPRRLSRR